jgi:hypothetical protein
MSQFLTAYIVAFSFYKSDVERLSVMPRRALMPGMLFFGVSIGMDVAVEGGEPGKERDADEILDPFDVLVEIDQGVDRFEFADRVHEIQHDTPPF